MKKYKIYTNNDKDNINFKRLLSAIKYLGKKHQLSDLRKIMDLYDLDYESIYRWAKDLNSPAIKDFKLFCNKLNLNAVNFLYNDNAFNPSTDFLDSSDIETEKDINEQHTFLKNTMLFYNNILKQYPNYNCMLHIIDKYYAIISFRVFNTYNSPCLYFHLYQCRSNGVFKTYFDRGMWNDTSKLIKYDPSFFSPADSSLLSKYLNAIYIDITKYSKII